MHDLHVTGVSTWWLYHLWHFMLWVFVHDDCTILHNCMLWDCYNNIPTCDCEHGIYYTTYRSRLCFSDIDHFCMDFVSARFCWVLCSLSFFAWVQFKVSWGWRIYISLTVRSWFRHESSTWTRNLELGLGLKSLTGTHISVEVVCRVVEIYNC